MIAVTSGNRRALHVPTQKSQAVSLAFRHALVVLSKSGKVWGSFAQSGKI
jgi:hypothetical protein